MKTYKYNQFELIARRVGEQIVIDKEINSPESAVEIFRPKFEGLTQEALYVICLNSKNKIIGITLVSLGILNSSLVHPREVFKPAILMSAASIIVAHNHPSGNPEPSQEDIQITKQLVEAGKIIGIPVYDHIIVTEDNFTSLSERRLI
ncbi:MAG: DNA repair protein RadC [Bacteroidota bacterium]